MNIKRTSQSSFNLAPNFGMQASFSSINDQITMGDNYSQIMIKGINALTMSVALQFQNLTDTDCHNAISFLQSQFDYEAQIYSNEGKFTNKRVEPFDFTPPLPYKPQKFICTNFTHEKQAFNINSISATFLCVGSSILDSVEASLDHNPNISSQLNFATPLSSSNSTQSAIISTSDNSCFLNDNNSIYNAIDYRTAKVQSLTSIQEGGSATVDLKAPFGFPNSLTTSQHTNLRHSIYIHEPNDCSFYPYASKRNGSTIPYRCFDFRASNILPIQNAPKYKDANITDFYRKFNKYGFNANLNNLQVTFSSRSDLEAKRILLFLESHLGYKKFCFHPQGKYGGSKDSNSAPDTSNLSFFYCPEWNHTITYLNNHNITATFVECLAG
jgi:phage-related protein